MQLVQYSKKTSTEALHLNTSVTQQHQHLEKKKGTGVALKKDRCLEKDKQKPNVS